MVIGPTFDTLLGPISLTDPAYRKGRRAGSESLLGVRTDCEVSQALLYTVSKHVL